MMEFKTIEFKDKEIIESYTYGRLIADIHFSNLFMWRHSRDISYAQCGEWLVVQTCYPNQTPFIFYPMARGGLDICDEVAQFVPNREENLDIKSLKTPPKELIEELIAHFTQLKTPFEIHSLQPYQVQILERDFPHRFTFIPRRERFDYIYHTRELIELSGRKFHKKKNHLNKFYLQYPQTCYESIDSTNLGELMEVSNAWFESQWNQGINQKDRGLYFENLGIRDALDFFMKLNLRGGLLRVDSEIVAFSFGEEVSKRCALIHIEKANVAFAGAYQAINQSLLKHEFAHLDYANREEDLGIEGLRKAKLSYQPAFLLEKYDARLL